MSLPTRRTFTRGGLLTALGLVGVVKPRKYARAGDPPGPAAPEPTIKELAARLGDLSRKYDSLTHNLGMHALFDPPLGSLVAFGGSWPPVNPADGSRRTELELGYALCDGRSFDDESLRYIRQELTEGLGRIIGPTLGRATSLPDLRGQFLRGIEDASRPVKEMVDKAGVRSPLERQSASTAMPTNAFKNSSQPAHDPAHGDHAYLLHLEPNGGGSVLATDESRGEACLYHAQRVRPVPEHTHTISGGDAETRVANVAINYIIKFRAF